MTALVRPYLLFLGDAPDALAAKVAIGVHQWRADQCVGQLRLAGCSPRLPLPELAPAAARAAGARTLVIGVANRGGTIPQLWHEVLFEALEAGFDIASGLHTPLASVGGLVEQAAAAGRCLHEVRRPDGPYPVATGVRRGGRRLLTVGTDCSVGKMYTALALERELQARGVACDFRATGQTGILIAGSGIPVDAVVADFIAGAVETLAPAAADDHWDLIEGQGSLFHPSYAGVSLGLAHGAQPTDLVLCHEPTRTHMRGLPQQRLPGLAECMALHLECVRVVNPGARFVGAAINTAALDELAARRCLDAAAAELGLPAVDPLRHGVAPLADRLLS